MPESAGELNFDCPPAEPVGLFEAWFGRASTLDVPNFNAVTLVTVDPDGRPSGRTVLLKGFDERGAVFFTNRTSRKGRALEANKRAAMVIHWDLLGRQVIIEGSVEHTSDEESDTYFASRPRGSQLGAWASEQSQPVADREALDARVSEAEGRFEGREVPRPPYWGGYRVDLERVEFWQAHPNRLHDRIAYHKLGDKRWRVERLFP